MSLRKKLTLFGSVILCIIAGAWFIVALLTTEDLTADFPFEPLLALLPGLGGLILAIFFDKEQPPEQVEIKPYDLERLQKNVQGDIAGRLNSELYPQTLILSMQEGIDASDESPAHTSDEILDIFDRGAGKLLILGAPGSGKTTILYFLAQHLLERFDPHQDTYPIPILFNLASWAKEKKALQAWLEDELIDKGVPRSIGQALIAQRRIIPLLDGLDEVAQAARNDCITAINQYGEDYGTVAVSCRLEEYQRAEAKLTPVTPLTVCDLQPAQITDYLSRAGHPTSTLIDAMHDDQTLRELAKTPLMLVIMGKVYAGSTQEEIGPHIAKEARLKHIYEQYVDQVLKQANNADTSKPWTEDETRHYLAWLARQLKQRDQTEFLIENMQPDLLQETNRRIYRRRARLQLGLTWGMTFGPAVGLTAGLAWGMAFGLAGGLAGGLGDIEPVKTQTLARSDKHTIEIVLSFIRKLPVGLVGGLTVGLVGGLAFGLTWGLAVGLAWGLAVGLAWGLTADTITESQAPNAGLTRSRSRAQRMAFIGLVAGGVLSAVLYSAIPFVDNLSYTDIGYASSSFIIIFVAWMWIDNGGETLIKHYTLRHLLQKEGAIPKDYEGFLVYAARMNLLLQRGGTFEFIHSTLRDYFAEQYDDAAAPDA